MEAASFFCPAPRPQAVKLSLKIAALFAGRRPSTLDESSLQPGRALAHASGAALARAFVVPRTQACPRDQVAGRREAAHVGADLSEKDAGRQFSDSGNACQDRDQFAKGREVGLDLLVNLRDGPVERVDLLEVEP